MTAGQSWEFIFVHQLGKDYAAFIRNTTAPTLSLASPEAPTSPNVPSSTLAATACSKCPHFVYHLASQFREHCKSDWHQYNLRNPGDGVSFEEWSDRLQKDWSDSSSSSESLSSHEQLEERKLVIEGVPYQWVVPGEIAIVSTIPNMHVLSSAKYMVVLLMRSGRFAGAVWDNFGNVLNHTSFKRYTVRRKNGGSQAKSDKSKNAAAHSAGAQIRRAQGKRLGEEVSELICDTWVEYLKTKQTVVFLYGSRSVLPDLLVGPLSKGAETCTIVKVPLSVKNPSYAEVCRVHKVMTQVAVHK